MFLYLKNSVRVVHHSSNLAQIYAIISTDACYLLFAEFCHNFCIISGKCIPESKKIRGTT